MDKEKTTDRKTVRITLSSKHYLPANMMESDDMLSLFNSGFGKSAEDDGPANPENYPEEMNNALQDMLDRDAGLTEGEIYAAGEEDSDDAFDIDDEFDDSDDRTDDIGFDIEEALRQLFEKIKENEDDDDSFYVYRTLGQMVRKNDCGREILEISYNEGEELDGAESLIVFDTTKPNAVSIHRMGSIISTLICEEKARHISAYQTMIMPFEIAIYTRRCEGSLDFENGGYIELDYVMEVRGANMQRTEMNIDIVVL